MSKSPKGILSLVLIPAILTLVVTVVRLVGELQGWDPSLFGTEAGGGMAWVGITWLVLVFGLWFGMKLARSGSRPRSVGYALGLYLVAAVVMAGGVFGLTEAGLVSFPTEEEPGPFEGMQYLLALMAIAALVALAAWPKLTITLMVYGLLARLPVVLITWLDLSQGWDTHYGALPPGAPAADETETFMGLITPQLTLWPFVFTPIAGGVFGSLGAKLAGSKGG